MRTLGIAASAACVAALALAVAAGPGRADADRIAFPDGYQKDYVLYDVIDRPDLKIVRYFYVDPASLKAAKPGKPVPFGTTLVMADKKAKLGAGGRVAVDKNGRMIADGDFYRVFVQKKGKGWGDDHPATMKNGDWEYAAFNADGTRPADAKYEACFSCHNNRAKLEQDFTFLFAPYLRDHKKG